MPRTPAEVIASAVERGAISSGRARDYEAMAASGHDISYLDDLAGTPVLAERGYRLRTTPVVAARSAGYGLNPLLDEMTRARPALVSAALAEGAPPRLFGDRDLPLVTASGVDPKVLASLPWQARRAVAAAPTRAEAYDLIDRVSASPGMAVMNPEVTGHNAEYVGAFRQWLTGTVTPPPPEPGQAQAQAQEYDDYTVERLHKELFGDSTYQPSPPASGPDPSAA
jgi:hypothetical protein